MRHRIVDNWRVRLDIAELWVGAINRHGGGVALVHLADPGITGNTHSPFFDLNKCGDHGLATGWLAEKGLD